MARWSGWAVICIFLSTMIMWRNTRSDLSDEDSTTPWTVRRTTYESASASSDTTGEAEQQPLRRPKDADRITEGQQERSVVTLSRVAPLSNRHNPHIDDGLSTLNSLKHDGALTAGKHALEYMRLACRADERLALLRTSPWKGKRSIRTAYNNQSYLFQNSVVCYDDRTRWYYDGASSEPRSFQDTFNVNEIQLKLSAVMHSMKDGVDTEFAAAVHRAVVGDKFFFHRSLGILSAGNWGTVSIYHFLMDLLLGMVSLILSNPELEAMPRDTIQMHENHIVKTEKWNLPPCYECLSVAPIVTDNVHQPNITISHTGPTDHSMRCFCGMVYVHHQTLTARAPCCSRPMTTRTHVSDVMIWLKQKLVEKWQFRPYGEEVEYNDYAKYGYWKNATNPRKPRLLFLLRTKSRYIGRKEELMQSARDMGFAVHSMAFEAETMERQFAAGRYADVVVGTHGAALTSLVMMDTSQDILCRSLIEMFHWAPLGRIVHYQKMAYMVNVSALGVQPIDVVFGKSVANPKKERKALKSFSYTWSGTGFHDQTSFYSTSAFKERLAEAGRNLKRCRDVDTSTMVLP